MWRQVLNAIPRIAAGVVSRTSSAPAATMVRDAARTGANAPFVAPSVAAFGSRRFAANLNIHKDTVDNNADTKFALTPENMKIVRPRPLPEQRPKAHSHVVRVPPRTGKVPEERGPTPSPPGGGSQVRESGGTSRARGACSGCGVVGQGMPLPILWCVGGAAIRGNATGPGRPAPSLSPGRPWVPFACRGARVLSLPAEGLLMAAPSRRALLLPLLLPAPDAPPRSHITSPTPCRPRASSPSTPKTISSRR
mmetsp:Transcript_56074/g.177678  ORF Transcript_56074/g.177678 Transcript_56074/m.177678 type:complete len:251 (-) Transcript_56074:686-1438(-)